MRTFAAQLIIRTHMKHNAFLGTASGRLGSTVFFRSKGVQQARVLVQGTDRKSIFQALQRAYFSVATAAYSKAYDLATQGQQGYEWMTPSQAEFVRANVAFRAREVANAYGTGDDPWPYRGFRLKAESACPVMPIVLTTGSLPSPSGKEATYNEWPCWTAWNELAENDYISDHSLADFTWRDLANVFGVPAGTQLTFAVMVASDGVQYLDNSSSIERIHRMRIVLCDADGNVDEPCFKTPAGGDRILSWLNPSLATDYPAQHIHAELSSDDAGDPPLNFSFITWPYQLKVVAVGCISSYRRGDTWARSTCVLSPKLLTRTGASLREAVESYIAPDADLSNLYLNTSSASGVNVMNDKALLARLFRLR